MNLFCRVTASFEQSSEALHLIMEKAEKLIVYEHNERSDNVHIHFYLENCTVSTDTLKNYFKRTGIDGGVKGERWSFKQARDTGCIAYMTKGKLDPVLNQGFDESQLSEFKNLGYDGKSMKKQTKLTQYVVRESQVQSKARQSEMIEEVLSMMEHKTRYSAREVIELIRQVVIVKHKTICGRYKIRDYYDVIMARKEPESFVQACAYLVQKDFF